MTKQHASASPPNWAKAARTPPADGEDVRQAVLDYVTQHPGTEVAAVIRDRTVGSRKMVENAIMDMLYQKPKRLRSELPDVTGWPEDMPKNLHASGRGMTRLYVTTLTAETGKNASATCEYPSVT